MKSKNSLVLTLIPVTAILCGCITPSKPDPSYVSEQFLGGEVRQLTVLPLVDARLDQREDLNRRKMTAGIKTVTKRPLRKRGFQTIYLSDLELPVVPSGFLEHPDAELLKALCPPGHRYCLLFAVEDLSQRRNFLSSEAGMIVTMGIIDGAEGTVLYYDMDVRREAGGGASGLMLIGTKHYVIFISSAEAMVKKLPFQTQTNSGAGRN